MKPIKKLTLPRIYLRLAVFSILVTTTLFSSSSARASSFLEQVQQVIVSLQTYIKQQGEEFSKQWEQLGDDLSSAINSTVGDLGIPDPLESGKKIKGIVQEQETDLIETSSQTQGRDAQRNWHQSYTYGLSQSVLGREGQNNQAQEAEMSNEAVETSSELSDSAQSDVITQDILKKMAVQNFRSAIITKSIHNEEQKQTRALSAANINLSDISSRMDEQARKGQAESNSSAIQIIQTAAFADAFWEK